MDRRLPHTPLYWTLNAAAEGLSRSEPGFRTANLLGRFDLNPGISLPLSLHGWSFAPNSRCEIRSTPSNYCPEPR